jgi:hypothetical protein
LSPLPLTEGRAECEMADGCFPSWQSHSLDVDPREPGGEHVQVPYGQQVNTRNWVISNGALERQSSEIRYCSDVVVNKAEVAIWPQPFETCVPLATDNCQICEPTFDEAVNAVEQICSDAQETQTEVEVSGFAARNCGLQIVMVSTGAGSPTYAFYDLQTNELVGWSNLNQPEACSGLVPADVTCYEDANFSQVTDLCPPTETETADAGVEE